MNYKRKRPRTAYTKGRSRGYWLHHWPKWWDVIYHTRPRRHATRECESAILRGIADADEVAWPLQKRPKWYYW